MENIFWSSWTQSKVTVHMITLISRDDSDPVADNEKQYF